MIYCKDREKIYTETESEFEGNSALSNSFSTYHTFRECGMENMVSNDDCLK